MKLINMGPNVQFVEDDFDCIHCFSYGSEVAAINEKECKYVEYDGPKYYSRTSCKHKKMFRDYYGY